MRVIGKCSCCGGDVCQPTVWYGVHPPTASCVSCGAMAVQPHNVIQTTPRIPYTNGSSGNCEWMKLMPQVVCRIQ